MSASQHRPNVDVERIARRIDALAALTEPDRPYTRRALTRDMNGASTQYVIPGPYNDSLSIMARESRVGLKSRMGETVEAVFEVDLYGGTVANAGG
ncbi:MAG: hypothetical protein R6W77_08225, partial [Trueperaceae bacterium]